MLALCIRMLIIIAAIQIREKYCDIYLIEHSGFSAHVNLVAYMQICHVLFMQISHALHDDCRQKQSDQRSSLLDGNINDVGEQTNY